VIIDINGDADQNPNEQNDDDRNHSYDKKNSTSYINILFKQSLKI